MKCILIVKWIGVLILLFAFTSIANAQYGNNYVKMIEQRANMNFNMGVYNIQQGINNQMQQIQNGYNRLQQANMGVIRWAAEYQNRNGYQPTDAEKDRWVQNNYPDVYNVYIQGKYGNRNIQSGNSQKDRCTKCNGTGKVIKTWYVNSNYETYCNICNQKFGYAHQHVTCPTCNGRGFY